MKDRSDQPTEGIAVIALVAVITALLVISGVWHAHSGHPGYVLVDVIVWVVLVSVLAFRYRGTVT